MLYQLSYSLRLYILFFPFLFPVPLVSVLPCSWSAVAVEATASLAADEAVLGLALLEDSVCSSIRRVL